MAKNHNESESWRTNQKLQKAFQKRPMAKFEKHIFICTNQRPDGNPRGCCNPSGEAELHGVFKEKLRERGISGKKVRANKSGFRLEQHPEESLDCISRQDPAQ